MNICWIRTVIRRPLTRVCAIATATALAICGSPAASAQTGLVDTVNASRASSGPMSFGPGTKVVSASSVRTAADVQSNRRGPNQLAPGSISQAVGTIASNSDSTSADSIAQVGYGCQSCNQHGCNGGCYGGGCNDGSCYGQGNYGHGSNIYTGSNVCGIPCNPYYYGNFEVLYFERRGLDNRSLIRNTPLGDENFEGFGRVTIGSLPNCVNGWEATFVGNPTWDTAITVTDPNGGINSLISAGPNFDPTFLDPFTNSNSQTIAQRSEYWSIEVNRTLVGWDVAKVLFGGRYISIEDQFAYAATKIQGPNTFTADLTSRTRNEILGLQAGLDLLYPVARHLYTDFRGRAGIYVNLADAEARLRNTGSVIVRNFSDDTTIAGVFELGGGLRWQLGQALAIRGGLELWYLTDYATGDGTLNGVVNNALGRSVDTRDVFYWGAVVGAELRY